MKNEILLSAFCIALMAQAACKKVIPNDLSPALGRLTQERSLLSADFCSITISEPDLHFGLSRNADSNLYVFTKSQLDSGLANFHSVYKYNDSGVVKNLDSSGQALSVEELMQMFTLIQSDSLVDYDPDTNYSALRLTFGMEGKKIILLYEPIVLKATGVPKECSVVSTNKYFRVDLAGNFISVNTTEFSGLVNNLRSATSKIHIYHPNNPGFFKFINASDSTSDVMFNIISFQQISKMYCDNNQGEFYRDKIKFSIVANRNESMSNNYRMHVVPNYRVGLSFSISGSYRNYAADYAQMCPTRCNIVSINHYD